MFIDIKIVLPSATALKLDDGSGDMKISGTTSSISVNDGSGNIAVSARPPLLILTTARET